MHICFLHSFRKLHNWLDLKDTTLYFSHLIPTLTMVIPAIDHIDETLISQSHDSDYKPAICAALGLTKTVLNCYYSATDHSEVYYITMGE